MSDLINQLLTEATRLQGEIDIAAAEAVRLDFEVQTDPIFSSLPQENLGVDLYEDIFAKQTRAFELFLQAAQLGSPEGALYVGRYYKFGLGGIAQNFEQAVQWFQQAAAQDNPDAQYELACCYQNAQGVPQDFRMAAGYLIAAAKQGHSLAIWTLERLGGEWGVEAQTAMGQHYLNCGDPQTALTWFKSAYPQNNSEPYFQIGYCYLKGVNVPQDLAQAKVYFEAASARGDNRAAIILGGLDSSERVPDSDDSELGSVASS